MQENCTAAQGQICNQAADLRLSIMKPLGAKWLIEDVEDMKPRKDVIINGFRSAGIMDEVKDLL